jgi:hypothetical protein
MYAWVDERKLLDRAKAYVSRTGIEPVTDGCSDVPLQSTALPTELSRVDLCPPHGLNCLHNQIKPMRFLNTPHL